MRTYASLGSLLALVVALALVAPEGPPTYAWIGPAALNTNAATDSSDDSSPQLATDGAGNWVAVWASDENLGGTIDIFPIEGYGLGWTVCTGGMSGHIGGAPGYMSAMMVKNSPTGSAGFILLTNCSWKNITDREKKLEYLGKLDKSKTT